jgi:endonuclease/exonuclease/phosphatase family metal-dependent hydrolase
VRIRRNLSARVVAAAAAAFLAVSAAPADATHRHHGHSREQLTVMTQNLYLGSPLTPALRPDVDTVEEFVAAVATIYGTAMATNFPARAEAIAATIAEERPDLVGLQEVTNWVALPTELGASRGAAPVSQDFLAILMAALERRGLDYEVAGVVQNADIGPAPLVAPQLGCGLTAADCVVSLKDRDVILVNDDTRGLHWWGTRTGRYAAQQSFTPPVGAPVSFARGWVTVEVSYRGERLRFADTHLEVDDFPAVQEAQAREFLAGPARTRHALVAVGDFNSAADGSTTDSYAILTSLLRDVWRVNPGDPGYTSGQSGDLDNPVSQLHQRIDLILTRSSHRTQVRPKAAEVVGDEPIATTRPRWASDHAGVVATLRVR